MSLPDLSTADRLAILAGLADGPTAPAPRPRLAAVEPGEPSSWEPIDLASTVRGLIDGTLIRPEPTVGRLPYGRCLFYPGKVNGLAGPSGGGKSLALQKVTVDELALGHHVVYVDLEDDEVGFTARLLALGADPEVIGSHVHYVRPERPFDLISEAVLFAVITEHEPRLVVVDSTGEAMALDGADPMSDDDTARWFRRLAGAVARLGPAVVVLDHMVKADDGTGLWPIGSQRKRAAISGAQFITRTIRPFSKDKAGSLALICAKDRHGTHVAGRKIAEVTVTPTADRLTVELHAVAEQAGPFRPTNLMEKVSRYLEDLDDDASLNEIKVAVHGSNPAKVEAVNVLIVEGYITRTKTGQAHRHRSARPFREATDAP